MIHRMVVPTMPSPWMSSTSQITSMLSWLSSPFFNLLLCLHKEGRFALTEIQRKTAIWFLVGLAISTAFLAAILGLWGTTEIWFAYIMPYFLMFPWVIMLRARPGIWLGIAIVYTLVVLGLGWASLIYPPLVPPYVLGCVLSTWLGNFVPGRR